jgi:hypothetical protein
MTAFEFQCAMRAHNRRWDSMSRMTAWHAANIMNMWSKRRVTVARLLGTGANLLGMGADEVRAHFRQKEAN